MSQGSLTLYLMEGGGTAPGRSLPVEILVLVAAPFVWAALIGGPLWLLGGVAPKRVAQGVWVPRDDEGDD